MGVIKFRSPATAEKLFDTRAVMFRSPELKGRAKILNSRSELDRNTISRPFPRQKKNLFQTIITDEINFRLYAIILQPIKKTRTLTPTQLIP